MSRSLARAGNVLRRAAAFAALLAFVAASAFAPAAARAAGVLPNLWFGGTRLLFDHARARGADFAVGTNDIGLRTLLARAGATLAYEKGERYVVVTSSDRRTIAFTVGDVHFRNGNLGPSAAFAPFESGAEAYVPLFALAKALYIEPIASGEDIVFQPRIGALETRVEGRTTFVTLHGATPLRFTRLGTQPDQISLEFAGVASSLDQNRIVATPGLGEINMLTSGSRKNPTTTVSFELTPGAAATLLPVQSPNEVAFAFAPAGTPLAGRRIPSALSPPPWDVAFSPPSSSGRGARRPPPALEAPAPTDEAPAPNLEAPTLNVEVPAATPAPAERAQLPSPRVQPPVTPPATAPPATVRPATAAPATARPATAAPVTTATPPPAPEATAVASDGAPVELPDASPSAAPPPATVTAISERGHGEALDVHVSLSGPVAYEWHRLGDLRWYLDLKGATLAIPPRDDDLQDTTAAVTLRVRQFQKGSVPVVRISLAIVTQRKIDLVPMADGVKIAVGALDDLEPLSVGMGRITPGATLAAAPINALPLVLPTARPFGRPPAGRGRLIVLDAGHGGSDPGAQHFGLSEKNLTLDIARRLRTILVLRGWNVKMTRETDSDVFGPNASAVDELQARCDVANAAGARLFLSIHVNSFTDSSLNGTTTYFYKASDQSLASALQRRMISVLGTSDQGVRHANFYVNHHTTMPAALVETAFISNRGDSALLATPEFRQKVAISLADGIDDYSANPTTTSSAAQ